MAINDYKYIIIGGSTKCGTTSLYEYLAAHPAINASVKKESRFFWSNEYPIRNIDLNYKDGVEKYDLIFRTDKKSNLRLEATPDYLYSKQTALLFKKSLNDCKFIFVLRNPVDRIVSWYKFSKQLNLINASKSIDEYINEQLNSHSKSNEQHLLAVEQGRYGQYLKSWFEIFGKENIKVCWYKDLSGNTEKLMKEICTFTQIDAAFYDNYTFTVFNKSVSVKDAESFNKYRTLRRNLRRILKLIPFGKGLKSILKPVDKAYMKQKTSTDFDTIEINKEVLEQLNFLYNEDKKLIEELTQTKVPW